MGESAIMAELAKTVTDAGYGNEDDEEFIGFADTVAMGGIQIIEAAALENFANYDKALGAAYTACNQCHMDYK